MITSSIVGAMGRLGNQMFSYATLLNVALYNGYDYGIPLSENKKDRYFVNDPRGAFQYHLYLDDCFNITAKDSSNIFPKYKYSEIGFTYNSEILQIQDNTDIVGYFQSELYFKEYKNDILREFEFKNEISVKAMTYYYGLISRFQNKLVSIHIRRGDYISLPDHHPLCPIEYYKNAIEYIKSKVNDDFTCVVFSDDIEWCIANLSEIKNITFFHENTYVDLCLMSMCDHNIIANSSYSWWGAYLNKNENKIVVSPKEWFGKAHNNLNTRDLIPNNWIKI